MPAPLISAAFGLGAKLIERLIPDPTEKAKAAMELARMEQAGELKELDASVQLALGQLKVNEAEAGSGSLFKGGWRPAVGWFCAFGLGYQFIVRPLIEWGTRLYGGAHGWAPEAIAAVVPPALDLAALMPLLLGMLGLGGLRTYERLNGAIPKGQ